MKAEVIDTRNRRKAERAPLDRPVRLEFSNVQEFMAAVTVNISETGMFVRAATARKVGSKFYFKLPLANGPDLIEGVGEVVWSGARQKETPHATGFGVRFVNLIGTSTELVQKIVAAHHKVGRASSGVGGALRHTTTPSKAYLVTLKDGSTQEVRAERHLTRKGELKFVVGNETRPVAVFAKEEWTSFSIVG